MFTAHLVGAKLKTERVEDSGPPENFVDTTVYRYRMLPDGTKELIGTMDPFPEKADADYRKPTFTPNGAKVKVEFEKQKEVENMARGNKRDDKDEKLKAAKKIMKSGKHMNQAAKELDIPVGTLHTWLKREERQTPTPEPVQVGSQEPEQVKEESAKAIIPKTESINPKEDAAFNAAFDEIQRKQGFTAEDGLPIKYVINNQYIMQHHDVAEEIAQLLDRKRADYGIDDIKKFGSLGCLIRTSDKVERLINLRQKKTANFETLEDTWRDIAGYAVLALIELREGR